MRISHIDSIVPSRYIGRGPLIADDELEDYQWGRDMYSESIVKPA